MKVNERMENHIDLVRELKNLWNMKVTMIPIIVGAFGTVSNNRKRDCGDWKSEEEDHPDHST